MAWYFKLPVIPDVIELGTKLKSMTFGDAKILQDRNIPVVDSRATKTGVWNGISWPGRKEVRVKEETCLTKVQPLQIFPLTGFEAGHPE